MYHPSFLPEPVEREKLAVEVATKHSIVMKPGFQNRRNQSEYLKNSFPAGFQIKNKLTTKLGNSIINGGHSVNPYGSYTEWTKGESEMIDAVSVDLTDPYADVAGPYLSELMNRNHITQKPIEGPVHFSDVIATELQLHPRPSKKKSTVPRAVGYSLIVIGHLHCSMCMLILQ